MHATIVQNAYKIDEVGEMVEYLVDFSPNNS